MALGEWKIANSQKINNQIKSSNSGAKAYALKALKSLEVSHSLPLDSDISATINQSNTEQGADQTVPLGSETPKKVSRELEFPPLPCKPSSPGATPAIILDVPRRTVSPLRNTKKVAASAAKTTTSKPKKNKRVSVPPPDHTVPNECIYDVPPPSDTCHTPGPNRASTNKGVPVGFLAPKDLSPWGGIRLFLASLRSKTHPHHVTANTLAPGVWLLQPIGAGSVAKLSTIKHLTSHLTLKLIPVKLEAHQALIHLALHRVPLVLSPQHILDHSNPEILVATRCFAKDGTPTGTVGCILSSPTPSIYIEGSGTCKTSPWIEDIQRCQHCQFPGHRHQDCRCDIKCVICAELATQTSNVLVAFELVITQHFGKAVLYLKNGRKTPSPLKTQLKTHTDKPPPPPRAPIQGYLRHPT
jgi:hypothetical protein